MRSLLVARLTLAVLASLPVGAFAQADSIVGAWESTVRLGADGEPAPGPAVFALYLPGGQFVELAMPANRPRLDQPLDEMTRDELLARLSGTLARRGMYRIDGDRLIRDNVADLDPAAEGRTESDPIAIERDAFVVKSAVRGNRSELRFRRLPPRRAANNLVAGVWERIAETNEAGAPRDPANPPRLYYYSPDGFYASLQLPPNRPKTDKPLGAMSTEEILARFARVVVSAGTYSLAANRLTRNETRQLNPVNEGRVESDIWRLENDVLITISPELGSKAESRFRRTAR
jgi:hypothetical protein